VFEQIRKWGFLSVRIDGEVKDVAFRMQVDRFKTHDIEIVIDNLIIDEKQANEQRLVNSIKTALRYGKGSLMILKDGSKNAVNFSKFLMCPKTGISYPEPEPNMFSFNSPYGSCPHCNGLGYVTEANINKLIPNAKKSIKEGGIEPLGTYKNTWIFKQIEAICSKYRVSMDTPIKDISEEVINTILYGSPEPLAVQNEVSGTTNYVSNFEGIINFIVKNAEDAPANVRKWAAQFMHTKTCEVCQGGRLKKESTYFRIDGKSIVDLSNMDIQQLSDWMKDINNHLSPQQQLIASEIIRETKLRLRFLLDLGIDYLTLSRFSQTLSGGEAQRIRLATQIGSKLVNVLYILDEPSIGLHQRDNQKLIRSLQNLRDIGNSIIVVEHDLDTMRSADYLIDMGHGAGLHGGYVAAQGSFEEVKNSDSLTGQYLSGKKKIEIPKKLRKGSGIFLELTGAKGNNLKNIDVKIPLGTITCITGVSGSGKSSLITGTLYPILKKHVNR
jgi:excinuclease ABC subunit A